MIDPENTYDSRHRQGSFGGGVEPTYRIVRFFRDDESGSEVVATGLTLAQAQAHCHNPETSSTTATSEVALQRTARMGAWFDGYATEES